ncbi:MAG TPA: FAD-dependent oxidoreductase [Candidatus Dormibacteraeota bacterium]|nr:FAD-dependent oxidoreductase [Candidatus Dormibacteraeota bacterium]
MKPRIVVLGAGFAGHTAALHLSRILKGRADLTVVAPGDRFTWFPSLIWVGTGTMSPEETHFELAPVYERVGADYVNGRAVEIHPDVAKVVVERADGTRSDLSYDYCLNATGPYLNFAGTPGLGPSTGNSLSVCSVEHAVQTREQYLRIVEDLKLGKRRRLLIGIGHPAATCEGAAFEYLMNVDADLRLRGLRDHAELTWLTNEPEPGDFGVDGIEVMKHGSLSTGASLVRGLLDESDVRILMSAGITKVESGRADYEQAGSDPSSVDFDFAMLIPQFRGIPIKYVAADGSDITKEMTQPNGFMNVDADYAPKPYDQYRGTDWPATYRSPKYANLYAAGIAFAPPHPLSKPKKTPSGNVIVATVPRTGMAAGIMGRTVAYNILDQIEGREPSHHARMSEIPAACIASMGNSFWKGSAASIIMTPVARDFQKYPKYGRDLALCDMEVGLGGAWTKRALHSAFLYKLQARPGWPLIPE